MASLPPSLSRDISPPRPLKRRKISGMPTKDEPIAEHLKERTSPDKHYVPTLATIEAGKVNHLAYFLSHLSMSIRSTDPSVLRLSLSAFSDLYTHNSNYNGHHFVIHQHKHPRAGVHYDLRLQFSETSSLSFAIPKGLPGNPNSRSIGRLAVETRVHNYWNHLIESASQSTGSLLIWDTGTYSVLPRKGKGRKSGIPSPQTSEDEESASEAVGKMCARESQDAREKQDNQKLISAFQTHHIRLRLHGTRLPPGYTITLRLPPSNDTIKAPTRRRNRIKSAKKAKWQNPSPTILQTSKTCPKSKAKTKKTSIPTQKKTRKPVQRMHTLALLTTSVRSINAIGSYSLIGRTVGLSWRTTVVGGPGKGPWVRSRKGGGFEPFLVQGREVERSIETGRLAGDVESDKGLEGFVGRAGWVVVYH